MKDYKSFDEKVKEKLKLGWSVTEIARHLKVSDMRVTRVMLRLERRGKDGQTP